nr:hypothetical protein [Tanacetum cinerariifolium]
MKELEELAESNEEDTETGKGGDEVRESEGESNEEETRQEEEGSFDLIPRTPEGSEKENSHVTLTPVNPDGPQESSFVSSFVTSMLNPTSDVGVESIFTAASSPIVSLQTPTPIMTPSTIATIRTSSEAPIIPPIIPSIILENLPTFNSAFCFDERLRSLETSFSEYRQTNPFVDTVSAIPGIVQQYMTQQMTEAVREAVKIQTDRLQDLLQRENDEFLRNIDENMKKIIKGQVKNQVKEQVSRILPRIEESVNATLEAEVLTRSSHSSRTSYAIAADLSEMELKKIIIEKMEGNNSIQRSDEQRNLYKALTELEYHLEEVYKATTDQLDWVNPEGQQYPHNLLQPLLLIPNNRGRRVIPFDHFINNDLEYLWGDALSRKYTTSVQPELVPTLHGFTPAVLDIPNNNNGWIEEEPEEDPEMEEEEEEEEKEEMDIEDEMDDPEIIDPYEIEEGELPPPPADYDTSSDYEPKVEAEDKDGDEATVGTITRASYSVPPFSCTIYVGSGSSRKVFAPSHIGKDVDMLHRKVKGLAQQMFDRVNTEYSTLKRLGEMDRYLGGISTKRRSEARENHKLKQSVSKLEGQM